MELLQNEQILEAYERGLEENYLLYSADGLSDEDIANDTEITAEQCLICSVKHSEDIANKIDIKNKKVIRNTQEFSDPLVSCINNILTQNKNSDSDVSDQQIADDILSIMKRLQSGNTQDLLITLIGNNMQLQLFNKNVTQNLVGDVGSKIDNYEILSKIQLRVMSEVRKNTMAINEIVNPKRTTFIKEANQHNHLHQENSEKKLENENELQKTEQLPAPGHVEDTEIIQSKEKVHEDK